MRAQVIIPLGFCIYKFIYWFRLNKFLQSIHKITNFKELETLLKESNSTSTIGSNIIVSIYSKVNSTSPLLKSGINYFDQHIADAAAAVASSSSSTVSTTIGASNTITESLIPIYTNTINNSNTGFLAVESTTSLIFECANSSTATVTGAISQQYNSVPSFNLSDITGQTVNIITDDVVFPLEKNFTKFIPNSLTPSTFMKFLISIFNKRNLIGQLIEERVLKPNLNLFTILSCKVGKVGEDIQFRLMNLPYQFSESKFDIEVSNAKFKTMLYGGLALSISTGIILYYGVPMVRDYLFHLKIKQSSISYDETHRNCSVCYESARDVVFLPCSHVVTCFGCSSMIASCPVCRTTIQTKKKIIFS